MGGYEGDEDERGDESRLGFALKLKDPAEFWLLLTDRYSGFRALGAFPIRSSSKVVMVSERRFLEGLVEWLAVSLKDELFCESCPVATPPSSSPRGSTPWRNFFDRFCIPEERYWRSAAGAVWPPKP